MGSVNREKFLHQLESVQAGLSKKEVVEQSDCFIFQEGMVFTFNDEVACSIVSGLEKEVEGAVTAEKFIALLTKLTEEEVSIEVEDGEMLVTGKRRNAGIPMQKEVLLPISIVEKPKKWKPVHADFCEAINVVQHCATTDITKFSMTCVHLTPNWIEAMDNLQFCRWKMKTGITENTLVRQSAIKSIVSLGMKEFSETESWLHFRNDEGLVLSCRRYIEEFKDMSEFLKMTGESLLLPKGLAEAADRAQIFSGDDSENNSVFVELMANKLRIRGQSLAGWYRETKKINYSGKAFTFLVSPPLLMDLVKRHNECIISSRCLKIDSGAYVYMVSLGVPEEVKEEVLETAGVEE